MGLERSRLGYPVSDELGMQGGRFSRFESGEIHWTPTSGATAIIGSGFGDDNVGVPVDG